MNSEHFLKRFADWFERGRIVQLARQSGWMIRQAKIDPFEFVVGLVFGQMSSLGLSLNAQASSYSEPVTRQAVDERYHQRAVEFFKAVFQECLEQSLEQSPGPSLGQELSAQFHAIHLVDSSSFDCPESLAKVYPGCGGAASSANCKMLLRYEYLRGQFHPLALLEGKRSDPGLAGDLPPLIGPNELLLVDKGFFKGPALERIHQAGGYYLMPLPRSVSQWLPQSDGTRLPLNLADRLRYTQENCVEWTQVHLGAGKEVLEVRVVAFRLSEESAARHRAALRENQRKQGRVPTAEALELAGWLILMTNASADKLPTHAMGYLYRVRWQIELIFKQCKSVLRLDVTQARENEFRVQCEIWARLIAAIVCFAWHSHLQAACWAQRQREISFAQVARQLQQNGMTLAHAFTEGGKALADRLYRLWRHLLKTTVKGRQSSRKTTWQTLTDYWLRILPQ